MSTHILHLVGHCYFLYNLFFLLKKPVSPVAIFKFQWFTGEYRSITSSNFINTSVADTNYIQRH